MPALYASFRFQIACLEAQQGFPFKARPMTLRAYEVHCEAVLDLAAPAARDAHDVVASDLSCAWTEVATQGKSPPSWRLAQRLMSEGTAGIIVPSQAKGAGSDDINVVLPTRWPGAGNRRRRIRFG